MKTNILKMIEQADVEWKPLGDIAILQRGRVISKTYLEENKGIYPVYSSQTQNNGEIGRIKSFDFDGEFLNWTTDGANAGTIFYRNGKFSITNVSGLIRIKSNSSIIYKFLYYWLLIEAKKHVYSGMGNPKLMSHQMEKILIPIPPLELQKEIVKRLDILTELEATLEAELSLRKKQYQYYRDFLLSENELAKVGFEWKTLGEVTLPTQNIKWKNQDDLFKYIDLTSVDLQTHAITQTTDIGADTAPSRAQKLVATDDVIFATTRPTQMRLTIIPKEFNGQIASTGYCVLRADKSQILPKWIYFNLSANTFKVYLEENQSGSAYPAISDSKVKDFKIPIPPLETQAKIVAILDKFDRLTSSIIDGLPKEIELRRKQYEYYRELLLGFARV